MFATVFFVFTLVSRIDGVATQSSWKRGRDELQLVARRVFAGGEHVSHAMEEWDTLRGHEERVWNLAWSPDGSILASCGQDKTVRLWRRGPGPQDWICFAVLEDAHGRSIRSCAWSNDGNVLATASFDATITIWERKGEEWELATTLEGHESEVKGVAFSASGTYLASCSRDKTVWIWESHAELDYDCVDVKQEHSQDVKSVTWHPHEDVLVSCSYDNTLRVWAEELDADEWECLQVLNKNLDAHKSTVWAASFNRTGKHMVSCSEDSSIAIWECQEQSGRGGWKAACVVCEAHTRPIYSIDWSKTTGAIATGSADDSIKLFRWEGNQLKELCTKTNAHQSDVNCVCWHPQDPTLLASCGDDGLIKIWKCRL